MTNQEIRKIAMSQSAEDMGCRPDDFLLDYPVIVPLHLGTNARKYLKEPIEMTVKPSEIVDDMNRVERDKENA